MEIVVRLSVEYCNHIHYDLSSDLLTSGYVLGETIEGQGFAIVQGRLGVGRIHHCIRTIGAEKRTRRNV